MKQPATENSYIQHGKIFIVPIIHYRLNFAVLVQRAAYEFIRQAAQEHEQIGRGRDLSDCLIAVALPHSIRAKVENAVHEYPRAPAFMAASDDQRTPLTLAELPRVSLITAHLKPGDYREVFPVSPCDGAIEAVRIANENRIPLRFIDRNIVPAHLSLRSCMYDPDWPDDGLVLDLGAKRYLQLIRDRISASPNRTEPVDTWREYHIAETLQQLEPKFRKILFVSDAKLVGHIQRLLEVPSLRLSDQDQELAELSTRMVKPPVDVIQQYLDDFPRLTEIYERKRYLGRAGAFNKWKALLEAICQGGIQPIDLRASARKYQTVFALLKNLLENYCRVAPTPAEVFQAFTSCFNQEFAQKVHYHLGAYRPQIEARRIRSFDLQQFNLLAFHPSSRDGRSVHTTRFCVPSPRAYWPTQNVIPGRNAAGNRAFNWPPEKKLMNRLRRIAYEAARGKSVLVRVEKFSGSMHAGVDARQTLRSYYNGSPTIYVRERRQLRSTLHTTGEPVVWLINRNPEVGARFVGDMVFGLEGGPNYDLWIDYCSCEDVPTQDEQIDDLRLSRVYGRLVFCDSGTKLVDIQKYYGNDFDKRIPKRREALETVLKSGPEETWWNMLLLTGLKYAKKSVICVSHDSFHISNKVIARAAQDKKSVIRLSLSVFSADQIMKLQHSYRLSIPKVYTDLNRRKTDDINDADVNDYVVENFGHVLNGLPHVTWEW